MDSVILESAVRKQLAVILNDWDSKSSYQGLFPLGQRALSVVEALRSWQAELGGDATDAGNPDPTY